MNLKIILTGVLFIPAAYVWHNLFKRYLKLRRQYNRYKIFHARHNCIVMYAEGYMRGWPPTYYLKLDITNTHLGIEPHLYFINTAKSNLSIAAMRFTIQELLDALKEAAGKGVDIKLIVNFVSVKQSLRKYKELMQAGVKISFYIDQTEQLNHIMHCKYILKDYDGENGFVCLGSMNLTGLNTILRNYEDVTFTSNQSVVQQHYDAFQESWELINVDNKNTCQKTLLYNHDLIK